MNGFIPTPEQLNAFIKTCVSTKDYYWLTKNNKLTHVKKSLTNDVIESHFIGTQVLGLSQFTDCENILYIGIDLDVHSDDEQQEAVINKMLFDITTWLKKHGYLFFACSSGSKGRHIHIYSDKPFNAKMGTLWIKSVLTDKLGIKNLPEIFPKQDKLIKLENSDTIEILKTKKLKPYGSQMKAPLALHPKHKLRAVILNDTLEEMSMEDSINFLVDFEKKMSTAKKIEFVITPEIEKRFGKKIITPEQLEKNKQKPIPKNCPFIENIACKMVIPSTGNVNRHSHIDPNVFQYAYRNKKPEILDNYCAMQDRDMSAFNDAENWVFNCHVIKKYLQHYQDDPVIKQCENMCTECEKQQEEYIARNLYNKLSEKIDKITDGKEIKPILKEVLLLDSFDQCNILKKIKDKTKMSIGSLKTQMNSFVDSNKFIEIYLEKKTGFYYLKHSKTVFEKTNISELLVFNEGIKFIKYNVFNPETRKYKNEKYINIILKQKPEKIKYSDNSSIVEKLLEDFSPTTLWKKFLGSDYAPYMVTWFREEFEQKAKEHGFYEEREGTWVFGAYLINNKIKVLNPRNMDYVPPPYKQLTKEDSIETMLSEENDITKAKTDNIFEFLNLIKDVPQTNEAQKKWWNTLAFSLSTPLKCVLADLGVDLFPLVLMVGERQQGKSVVYARWLINTVWSIQDICNDDDFKGTTAKAASKLTGTLRPQVFDEISDLGKRLTTLFKGYSTTPGGIGGKIRRMNINLESKTGLLSRPVFMTANKFNIDDPAMKQRIYIIPFDKNTKKENKIIPTKDMLYVADILKNNNGCITKVIYELYEETDVVHLKNIIEMNKQKYKNESRKADLQIYLDVGLLYIKKLYEKFNIETPDLTNVTLYDQDNNNNVINIEETNFSAIFHDIITNLCVECEFVDQQTNQLRRSKYTILDFVKKIDTFTDNENLVGDIIDKFKQNGVCFKVKKINDIIKITDVVLFKNFINVINKKLSFTKMNISTIKNLGDMLIEIGKVCLYDQDEKKINHNIIINYNQKNINKKQFQNGLSIGIDSFFELNENLESNEKKDESVLFEKGGKSKSNEKKDNLELNEKKDESMSNEKKDINSSNNINNSSDQKKNPFSDFKF